MEAEAINWSYLLGFGIILIGIEAFLFSFFLLWIGLGFIIVALLSYGGFFHSALAQIAVALLLGLILVLLLRKWSSELLNRTQDSSEESIHTGGIGEVYGKSIKMDGTFWRTDADLSSYKDGDKIEVIDIVDNKAVLKD